MPPAPEILPKQRKSKKKQKKGNIERNAGKKSHKMTAEAQDRVRGRWRATVSALYTYSKYTIGYATPGLFHINFVLQFVIFQDKLDLLSLGLAGKVLAILTKCSMRRQLC